MTKAELNKLIGQFKAQNPHLNIIIKKSNGRNTFRFIFKYATFKSVIESDEEIGILYFVVKKIFELPWGIDFILSIINFYKKRIIEDIKKFVSFMYKNKVFLLPIEKIKSGTTLNDELVLYLFHPTDKKFLDKDKLIKNIIDKIDKEIEPREEKIKKKMQEFVKKKRYIIIKLFSS